MGTWGDGHFENDGALDFVVELTSQDSLAPIETAFDEILSVKGYIDVDYGEYAIAAAEIIALLRGKPLTSLPDDVIQWHNQHQLKVNDALVAKAIQAVELTTNTERSEFAELRDELDGWANNITDLLARLR